MTQLADRLSGLLENRGKRLADLARQLRVNKGTVSRWNERGVPHKRLQEVEDATGIPPCDLRPDLAHLFVKARAQ
jgi:transcriptional regulator with XRE-family HTH domain